VRALYFGEGLFETIRWTGRSKKLRLHHERLKRSADFFSYPFPDYGEFVSAIEKATKGKKNLYVKLLVLYDGGERYWESPTSYRLELVVRPLPKPPRSVNLCFSPYRRHSKDPLAPHKTTNYLFNALVKRQALRRGFFDCVILNEEEKVTETSSANILVYKDKKFITPAKESGLLFGTTLRAIADEVKIKEEKLTPSSLLGAEYVFILNSIVGVVPVKSLDGHTFGIDESLTKELNSILKKAEEPLRG